MATKMKLKIINVVGARPNYMKMAPLLAEFSKHPGQFAPLLVHTGQHYDEKMSKLFFEELNLPKPDVYLGVGSGSHATQTGKVMLGLEELFIAERPDLVIVVGDVNSTMAATIVAAKLCISVAHVEAGLRSFDRTMPEEVNRIVTDALSTYCFTTSADANENLRNEGVPAEKIFLVGNVMIDTLLRLRERSRQSAILTTIGLTGKFGLVTLHRPGNVDTKETLVGILAALEKIQQSVPLVFPVHPRTHQRLKDFGLLAGMNRWPNLKLIEPVGYLDSLCLMSQATVVLTDSGGVQEETTALGIPCLTIRTNTERPVTITEGSNTLVGTDREKIISAAMDVFSGRGKQGRVPQLWDGRAAERIVQCLLNQPPK